MPQDASNLNPNHSNPIGSFTSPSASMKAANLHVIDEQVVAETLKGLLHRR
jgi:hypothetical protein